MSDHDPNTPDLNCNEMRSNEIIVTVGTGIVRFVIGETGMRIECEDENAQDWDDCGTLDRPAAARLLRVLAEALGLKAVQ